MDEEVIYESSEETEAQTDAVETGCKICKSPEIEEGYKLNICAECRNKLVKRPFPFMIKGFFCIIVLFLIFALIKFPSTLSTGIEYQRGLSAEKASKYVTAMHSFEKVLDKYPNDKNTLTKLAVSYYKNQKIDEALETLDKLTGKELKTEVIQELNELSTQINYSYMPSQGFLQIYNAHKNDSPQQLVEVLQPFVAQNPEDGLATMYLENALYDIKNFDEAERVALNFESSHPDNFNNNLFLAAVYREKGQFGKAVDYCQKELTNNSEDAQVFISLSRIELKRHQDKKALDLAQKAYSFDNEDAHAMANLSMVYHYNNIIKERDSMFEQFKKAKNINKEDLDLLTGIFNGTVKWRD
jgi:tetratricopeptide (TPR) repeat protein